VKAFKGERVSLLERADIGCVLVTAAVDGASVLNTINEAARVELPAVPGMVGKGGERVALWLSPRSWMIHCQLTEEATLILDINSAFPDKLVHAVQFSDAIAWLELSGSGVRDLLAEGGFVSLERDGLGIGRVKRTLIAQIATVVVRESESLWLVGVERSRAAYFARWLSVAAG
jgi:heterotetrameric sarcosine oxidase gamma subunit